jgi:hypothetical protein
MLKIGKFGAIVDRQYFHLAIDLYYYHPSLGFNSIAWIELQLPKRENRLSEDGPSQFVVNPSDSHCVQKFRQLLN